MRRNHIFKPPMPRFFSRFHTVAKVAFPEHSNTRIMMMPIKIGNMASIPPSLQHYGSLLKDVFAKVPEEFLNRTGYLTIDEARVKKGSPHRRPDLHVDGVYRNGSEYTPNPLGIEPDGPIIENQRSEYMNFRPK